MSLLRTLRPRRAGFEDKILSSDIVFLRAWVAVELPRFFNPVTNLLAKSAFKRDVEPRGKGAKKKQAIEEAKAAKAEAAAAAAAAAAGTAKALGASKPDLSALLTMPLEAAGVVAGAGQASGLMEFQPSPKFTGARPGFIFKLGSQGQGYYKDNGPHAAVANARAEAAAAAEAARQAAAGGGGTQEDAEGGAGGWLNMRTVAQLRREMGVGAPRNPDSLYKPIERAPRKFNPLRIPLSLQVRLGGFDWGG